ncbi:MAG: hypothetical protein GTO30_17725, partial [Acidobacteria bacterium]|nr:hypothetical protein [Acidobacteriota bacterium]NIO60222.1 hypothetical protein [Acidobacteriota bacterium]NIQ86487.1 hypothetical protein [Acidobacteriota bacterium]
EVQTLSDDHQDVLREADVQDVINSARAEIPNARAAGDWLYAYELLYRLNVLFE